MSYRSQLSQIFASDPSADAILEHFDRRAAKIPSQGGRMYWSSWGPERMAFEESLTELTRTFKQIPVKRKSL